MLSLLARLPACSLARPERPACPERPERPERPPACARLCARLRLRACARVPAPACVRVRAITYMYM